MSTVIYGYHNKNNKVDQVNDMESDLLVSRTQSYFLEYLYNMLTGNNGLMNIINAHIFERSYFHLKDLFSLFGKTCYLTKEIIYTCILQEYDFE